MSTEIIEGQQDVSEEDREKAMREHCDNALREDLRRLAQKFEKKREGLSLTEIQEITSVLMLVSDAMDGHRLEDMLSMKK